MAYTFEQIFAADPSTPENVATNGLVTIFAPGDVAQTPLTITTVDGLPLANPIQVNDAGYGPAFMHATLDRVAWAGGGFTGFFTSYDGMKEEAVAARNAATAVEQKILSGTLKGEVGAIGPIGLPGVNAVPADNAVAEYVRRGGTATNEALRGVTQIVADEVVSRPSKVKNAQALAVFTFDDGVAADRDHIRPLLNGRGVRGTFGVTTNNVGNTSRLSWADVRQLMADGHEIANHSATHKNLNTSDASIIAAEIDASHATFLSNGVIPTGFIWPFAASSTQSRAAARRHYKYALGGTGGTTQPLHTFAIKRVEITPTSLLAAHQAQIDSAMTNAEMLIFLVHAADWNGSGFQKIGQVIDYAKSMGLPIVTADEAFNRMGNVVDTGDMPGGVDYTVVTGQGIMFASQTGPISAGFAGISATARPDSFPNGRITIQTFSAIGNDGWPAASSGTVHTQRFGNHIAYTRQVIYTGAGSVFYRTAVDAATWSAFVRLDNGNITGPNVPSGADPVTAFDVGTTITRLTNPGSTGPNGQAGTLTTNRPHLTQHGYADQEFNIFGSNTFLRRGCASDGSWLPWVTLTTS